MATLAAAALVGGGALRSLAEKSESFVMRRRGNRAVWPGERGDEELHEMVQQRPGHWRAPSTQIPDAPVVRHFRSRLGAKGGVIISDARITYLSKFRAPVRYAYFESRSKSAGNERA